MHIYVYVSMYVCMYITSIIIIIIRKGLGHHWGFYWRKHDIILTPRTHSRWKSIVKIISPANTQSFIHKAVKLATSHAAYKVKISKLCGFVIVSSTYYANQTIIVTKMLLQLFHLLPETLWWNRSSGECDVMWCWW